MTRSAQPRLMGSAGEWLAVALCAALGVALVAFVDLTPRIDADFFFSSDDPQVQQAARVEEAFGTAPQVFVAVGSSRLATRTYLTGLRDLTRDLSRIDGVAGARSITHGPEDPEEMEERDPDEVFEDLTDSPFWTRLLAPDRSASFIVLQLGGDAHEATIAAIDRTLDRHERRDFRLDASGVPYVSEHVRRQLTRDLRVFSVAAFAAFALLVGLLFRSVAILVGTMVSALTACFATFLVRALAGMPTDILTPNLVDDRLRADAAHVVYLAAEWQQTAREVGGRRAVGASIRLVGPASAWSLAANLLGFGSLVLVSAKPLRQFGISGAIAAVAAIACAYLVFPRFLRSARPPEHRLGPLAGRVERFFTTRHPFLTAAAVLTALAVSPLAWRVETDPSLPAYFSEHSRIRTGLSTIDRSAGSSPLDLVVEDARGRRLDDDDEFERLEALQRRLEDHPDVGSVISIALLMAETDRQWYAFLFSWKRRLDELDKPEHGRIGRTFITGDRRRGRFVLRMREEAPPPARGGDRGDRADRARSRFRAHGCRRSLSGAG